MSKFEWMMGSGAPSGWDVDRNVVAQKHRPETALLRLGADEDGRNPTDVVVLVQAAEGILFPIIDVKNCMLGLQKRWRPQPKDGVKWGDVIGDKFPQSFDPTKIGRNAWTITRWFGDLGDDALQKAIAGEPDHQDPRLEIIQVPHIIPNDGFEVHRTHISIGLFDRCKQAADNALGKALSKITNSLTWVNFCEMAKMRARGEINCGFTMAVLGDILLCRPNLFYFQP
jgi:hypothetical protein